MEINKLERKIIEKGFTLIPLKFYLKNGRVKVDVGVCKGKKMYDKRATIKEKDMKRDTERIFRVK
jgi:SsrA-binding protein